MHEAETTFKDVMREKMPWLRLGEISFSARTSKFDFEYHGDFKVPLWLGAYAEHSRNLKEYLGSHTTFHDICEVSFHELSHLIVIALDHKLHRLMQKNYGYFEPHEAVTMNMKRIALEQELRVFAIQNFFHESCLAPDICDVDHVLKMTEDSRFAESMSTAAQKKCYTQTRKIVTKEFINNALDEINETYLLVNSLI